MYTPLTDDIIGNNNLKLHAIQHLNNNTIHIALPMEWVSIQVCIDTVAIYIPFTALKIIELSPFPNAMH